MWLLQEKSSCRTNQYIHKAVSILQPPQGPLPPSINVEGKEMLILPSNTLPFIWDFQSTQHWAFVLLMFRGPKRGKASLGNLIQTKQHHPSAEDYGLIRLDRPGASEEMKAKEPVYNYPLRWLGSQFCCPEPQPYMDQTEHHSQAPHTRGRTSPQNRQERPKELWFPGSTRNQRTGINFPDP